MWLSRGRKLFYLSRRVDGKPTKFYIGTGPRAEMLAAEVENRKSARQAANEACASWNAQRRAAENPLDGLCAGLDRVVTATLIDVGYRPRDRSKWRKRGGHPEVQDGRTDRAADPAGGAGGGRGGERR